VPRKAASSTLQTFERFEPKSRAHWRKWLERNHATCPGLWLVFRKKPTRVLPYADAVEEALCFGWIDSLLRPIDGDTYMQLFTPRKAKSRWSALNKRRVAALLEQRLIAPAGQAAIDAAKRLGTWTAMDEVEALVVPPDLKKALARDRTARAEFERLAPSMRKGCLHHLHDAKTPETRARRLAAVLTFIVTKQRWTKTKPTPP
jgi:uncharacterized protein YdeI (YjbR/CyaY-like superfamily)